MKFELDENKINLNLVEENIKLKEQNEKLKGLVIQILRNSSTLGLFSIMGKGTIRTAFGYDLDDLLGEDWRSKV